MTRRTTPRALRRAPTSPALPRRAVLRGGLAGGLAAAMPAGLALPAFAADGASREFEVLRDGAPIGRQITTVSRQGEALEVTVRVRLLVKVLGIGAYRYELDSRERWEGGRLVSLEGETNDDGEAQVARVRREGERLISSGSWSGEIPDDAATTTYWTPAFLQRGTWISTQTGRPLCGGRAGGGGGDPRPRRPAGGGAVAGLGRHRPGAVLRRPGRVDGQRLRRRRRDRPLPRAERGAGAGAAVGLRATSSTR